MSLTKYALITFLIGLILLFFLSRNLEPKLVKISDINSKMVDSYVKIQGDVIKSKTSSGVTILTVNDSTEFISVVSYSPLNVSGKIEVMGKVKDYKGSLEIEIEKIKDI
jgi:RecJ-like exonuclease